MKNEQHIIYTFKHRKIVMFLANKYVKNNREKLLKQIEYHDLDKLYMYMFYEKKDVSRIHRELSFHHDNKLNKTPEDYVEMVFDWESARYSKPDKPLNAYDTLYKFFPHMENEILPILKEYGLDQSNTNMEQDVLEFANNIDVTKEDICEELKKYVDIFTKKKLPEILNNGETKTYIK